MRDLTKDKVIDLIYYRNEDQFANIFNKPLKLALLFFLLEFVNWRIQFEEGIGFCINLILNVYDI